MLSVGIILLGLALGFLSQFLTKRRDPGAFVMRMIAGLVSAFVGIILVGAFEITAPYGILLEIAVIVIFLALYQLVFGKRNAS
jgi:uncharacterized membrane protein YeaQ/YmgE (transglycosylase-associated protein family)